MSIMQNKEEKDVSLRTSLRDMRLYFTVALLSSWAIARQRLGAWWNPIEGSHAVVIAGIWCVYWLWFAWIAYFRKAPTLKRSGTHHIVSYILFVLYIILVPIIAHKLLCHGDVRDVIIVVVSVIMIWVLTGTYHERFVASYPDRLNQRRS